MNTYSDGDVLAIGDCTAKIVDPDRVTAVAQRMPSADELGGTAHVFGLLSDANRLRLLVALLDGELCVCDLAAVTGQSESAVSHALRLLRAHRVVTARRSGRMAYYRLDDPHVRMLLDLALAHTQHTEVSHPEHEANS